MASLTDVLAMDCEMVGAGAKGRISMAAQVAIVNEYGQCVYNQYVKPYKPVTDYRNAISGITQSQLQNGRYYQDVKRDVASMIRGRILVGHAIDKDLKNRQKPSLKYLARRWLGLRIQTGAHNAVEDARAVMKLYKFVQDEWEASSSDDSGSECYDDYGPFSCSNDYF